MFSSSSNSGNPFSYTTTNNIEENPNFNSQEDPPSLFLHFPSPFLDSGDSLLTHFEPPQDHEITNITNPNPNPEQKSSNGRLRKRGGGSGGGAKNPDPNSNPRRRTGKKDRHSKICTATGLRDRRMRLSVQIARKFFDLQDMLGFDKASKTIEWLFSKSKGAIKDLTKSIPRMSNHSCKKSNVMEESVDKEDKKVMRPKGDSPREKKSKKSAYNPYAKELRDKARARARERTMEKMMIRTLEIKSKQNPNSLERLGLETADELSHDKNSPLEEPSPSSLENELASVGIIENFLGNGSGSTSSTSRPIFAPDEGIFGNWDMESARINPSYRAMSNMVPILTGNVVVHEQNPNSTSTTTTHFQPQLLGNQFYCRWQ